MGTDYFSDPRLRAAEKLAWEAELILKGRAKGDPDDARAAYSLAADLQAAVAAEITDAPRVRGVLVVSAVSLYLLGNSANAARSVKRLFLEARDLLAPGTELALCRLLGDTGEEKPPWEESRVLSEKAERDAGSPLNLAEMALLEKVEREIRQVAKAERQSLPVESTCFSCGAGFDGPECTACAQEEKVLFEKSQRKIS